MRIKLSILFTLCLISTPAFSQSTYTLRGVIRDAKTMEAMPFATVFFAGTTIGTTTNEKGGYELQVDSKGTYDLIVKFIGYETYAAQVTLGAAEIARLNIDISPGAKDLGSVVVVAKKDAKWKEYMKLFERVFLGRTRSGLKAVIQNKESIDFIFDENTQQLSAFAYEPLVIENVELGYNIKYYLEQFFVEYSTGQTGYYGYASFDFLEPNNKRKAKKWEKNRELAYKGSSVHFFNALYNDRLKEEGFEIEVTNNRSASPEILAGQQTILNNMVILNTEGGFKQVAFGDYLRISYLKEKESSLYRSSTTLGGAVLTAPATPSNYQESWFQLLEGYKSIEFEVNGFVRNPLAFQSYGYWAFEKVGDMVPLDYIPSGG